MKYHANITLQRVLAKWRGVTKEVSRRSKIMRKDKIKGLMILGALLGVIGLILIFFSDDFGTTLTNGLLAALDNIDTMDYEFKVKAKTNNFLVTGSILFGIGLSTVVFSFYKSLNINNRE